MRFLIIVVLGLGIFFRFVHLDHKVFWYDEAFTSLRSSGYTEAEVVDFFSQASVEDVAALQKYQVSTPDKGIADVLHSLAVEDTQHPPFYYVLSYFWMKWVGSSIGAVRLWAAILSLLALPCMYWLCWELFTQNGPIKSTLPAWIGCGLFAVSPIQVLYAQEVREYGLWAVTTIFATAALLRAVRLNTPLSWGLYALSLAIGLYTFLFSGLVAIAHALYIVGICKFRLSKPLISYLIAAIAGGALFLPWAWIVKTNLAQVQLVTHWTGISKTRSSLIKDWYSITGRIFFDGRLDGIDGWIHLGIVFLLIYAVYELCRKTPRSVWLLIICLAAVPALSLMLPDFIKGGLRSTVPRYLIPTLIGIQLAATYLFAQKLSDISLKPLQRAMWQGAAIALFVAGIVSCGLSANAITWWNKDHNPNQFAIAQTINQSPRALLVSDAQTGDLLSLSHYLNPSVNVLLQPLCYTCHNSTGDKNQLDMPEIPAGYSDVFFYHPRPSNAWIRDVWKEQNYIFRTLVSEKDKGSLWRISQPLQG